MSQNTKSSTKPRRPWRRRLLVFFLLLAVVCGCGFFYLEHMEKEAFRLANAGRSTIQALSDIATSLKEKDFPGAMNFYQLESKTGNNGPWSRSPAWHSDQISGFEWASDPSRKDGPFDLASQLESMVTFHGELDLCKFKLTAFTKPPNQTQNDVEATLWLRGKAATGEYRDTKLQFRLVMKWREDRWRITRQHLSGGETVTGVGNAFEDVAIQAGIHFKARLNPMFEKPPWKPKRFHIIHYSPAGVSAADYDGDGWEDLFFGDGLRASLYRNRRDGSFEETTTAAGLTDDLVGVYVGIFADFNNDGHKDLFLGRSTLPNLLFANDGDGTFSDVSEAAGLGKSLVTVAAAADYDNDGDLDLYIGRYLDAREDLPTTLFYARNGAGNSLLRNDGEFRFTDVTETTGVREGGLTLGVSWGDMDQDGDQDLYVANDFGRNALFRNEGDGHFTDVTRTNGALDVGYGMSANFGDIDNDGDLDIYVANVHSSQRWYGQAPTIRNYIVSSMRQGTFFKDFGLYRELYDLMGSKWTSAGDHLIRGNSLLLNDGGGTFTDASVACGANPFGWYWGTAMFDYDNDGHMDLYGANGWISAPSEDDY